MSEEASRILRVLEQETRCLAHNEYIETLRAIKREVDTRLLAATQTEQA